MKVFRLVLVLLPVLLFAGALPAFSSTPAPTRSSVRPDISALVKDPAVYRRDKAAANERYAKWAARKGIAVPHYSTVAGSLNQPGITDAASAFVTPPDTTGAIGPNNYVEMINSEIGVYDNTNLATPTATADQATFVGDASAATCDGQVQWDQEGQRWLYAALDCFEPPSEGLEKLYFGFSKGPSPLPLGSSGWCQYTISTGNNILDYPKLGHDDTQIMIGFNSFGDSLLNYIESGVFVLPKPAPGTISTCPSQSTEVTGHLAEVDMPGAFTPIPVNIADSSSNGYVVATQDVSNGPSTQLDEYTISPSVSGSSSVSPTTAVTVPSYSLPASVPQPGTSDTLDSLDGRLTQAVAVTDPNTGHEGIWTQHTIDGGGPSVVRWYELTPGATTPTQTGTVQGPGGAFAFMGAISPTADGENAAIFYNSGSGSQLADFRVQDRHASTPAGTMVDDSQLAASGFATEDFSCNYYFPGDPCRWGDYTGASPDPLNSCLVWGSGEITAAAPDLNFGTPQWGTQNSAIDASDSCFGLTLSKSGTGSGSVTSAPNGLDCGSNCAADFSSGTSVELTATPSTDSTFTGWSGACSGAGACDVTMSQAQAVTATFALRPFQALTVSKTGSGAGTVSSSPSGVSCGSTCSHSFDYGTPVQLTASPAAGSTFTGWSGACSGTGTCSVTMSQAQSVTATFALVPETLSVAKSGAGSGTVSSTATGISCGSTCSASFNYGTSVTLAASAGTGSVFRGWSGACTGNGTCTVLMKAAQSVTATFALAPETLTVTKSGSGSGKVSSTIPGISCGSSCSHVFDYGTSVTLTAAPASNAKFAGWSGACSGTGSCTVSMSAATSVTAKFTKIVCIVPAVKGDKLSAAKSAITAAHCSVGTVTKKTSTTVKKNKVISQSPKAGKHLAKGASVDLVVSKGK